MRKNAGFIENSNSIHWKICNLLPCVSDIICLKNYPFPDNWMFCTLMSFSKEHINVTCVNDRKIIISTKI